MNVDITSRHAQVPKQVKEHVQAKLDQVLRHADGINSVHVVLDAEKGRHRAEMVLRGRNLAVKVKAEEADPRTAIDACAEKLRHKLEHQLGRTREKKRRATPLSRVEAELAARSVLPAPAEKPKEKPAGPAAPKIVRSRARKVAALSLDEARTELDKGADVVVFREAKSGRLHVLHRRKDGKLGLVDTGAE